MNVLVVGAGPAGLATAILLAEAGRCRHIDVIDRAAEGETPGWGITLRNDALAQLGLNDAPAVRKLQGRALWYRGQAVVDLPYPPGIHLATTSRADLLALLRARCASAGVAVRFDTPFASLPDGRLAAYDLIIGADGADSAVRRRFESSFGVTTHRGGNWYAWLGTRALLSKLSIFLRNDDATLLAWAYQYSDRSSTLIVECTATTFEQRRLAEMPSSECTAMIAKSFDLELGGAEVVAETTIRWRRFRGVSCRRLFHGNVVLIGDAAHTTHFSQGFGTAFAFDDAFALHAALAGAGTLREALETFESAQQPKVAEFQLTAARSMEWGEALVSAAEDRHEHRVQSLIGERWRGNEVTRSPFSGGAHTVQPARGAHHKRVVDEALQGYRVTQMLHAVAKLGVADHLARGARSAVDLAAAVGAHPEALARVLRALVDAGVFAQDENGGFLLGEAGRELCSDAPNSIRSTLIMHGEPWWWRAWGGLHDAVKTGTTAFDAVHGIGLFGYLAAHPEAARLFNAAMLRMTSEQAANIVAGLDLQHTQTLLDVGGGHGALVLRALQEFPHLTAVVFDDPAVVGSAIGGLSALVDSGRCRAVGGDFFAAVPPGADTYILKDILHDWDDEDSLTILRNVRQAMTPTARLLVIERLLPADSTPSPATLIDVAMLVLTGGRERTELHYRTLLTTAGFTVRAVTPFKHGYGALEAAPGQLPMD